MTDIRITNCHTHTFTNDHVPLNYPHPLLRIFKRLPWLVRTVGRLARLIGRLNWADEIDRLHQFQKEGNRPRQADILASMRNQYPGSTRFVVLPMDMEPIGHGPVRSPLKSQHDELFRLWEEHPKTVIPFATVHPARDDAAKEVERCLDMGFRGLKIYPRLGFPPCHDVLMNEVYPMLVERNLPVMTHCSRGGVRGNFVGRLRAERYTEPDSYIRVIEAFPKLRICLAHFGGAADWRDYTVSGYDPDDDVARASNWQMRIRDMIAGGKYPGIWTDISYTLFHFEDNIPFLKLFLSGNDERSERLRRRVLFGSDFYMTRQEQLSERAVCIRLRNELGEELFERLAATNPEKWLGERPADDEDKRLWKF